MADHKELIVWKESMILVKDVYLLTNSFPKSELYSLTSQIRKSAISIPSNIAEGAARAGDKEFIQFLYIAIGSVSELETQLLLAIDLNYLESGDILKKIKNIRKMLTGLIKYLKSKSKQ